jgi:hypothetical protein
MTEIIIRAILGLFIYYAAPEIAIQKWKFLKNTKKFIALSFKLVGVSILISSGIKLFIQFF